MTPLSARERKLVAVGALMAAISLAWLALVQPLWAGFGERKAEREQLLAQYAQNERLIARIDTLRRTAEEQARLQPVYAVRAANAEAAGEVLKSRLETTLSRAGGEFKAAESLEAPKGWSRAIATATLTDAQLARWLASLLNEPPYLVINSLTLSADRALDAGRPDKLDAKLEASLAFTPANAR